MNMKMNIIYKRLENFYINILILSTPIQVVVVGVFVVVVWVVVDVVVLEPSDGHFEFLRFS